MSTLSSHVVDQLAASADRRGPALRTGTAVAALGAGTMGGVFFAFSTFVMAGLRRLPAPQGVAAMQSVNVTAVRPAFMTVLFGTALLSLVLGGRALTHLGDAGSRWVLVGCAAYLVGTIGVTIAFSVPLNDSLALVRPGDGDAAQRWAHYVTRWTAWNHVRVVSCLVATWCFLLAARGSVSGRR